MYASCIRGKSSWCRSKSEWLSVLKVQYAYHNLALCHNSKIHNVDVVQWLESDAWRLSDLWYMKLVFLSTWYTISKKKDLPVEQNHQKKIRCNIIIPDPSLKYSCIGKSRYVKITDQNQDSKERLLQNNLKIDWNIMFKMVDLEFIQPTYRACSGCQSSL